MQIPILPMTSDADNEIVMGHVYFDVLTPKMKGDVVRAVAVKERPLQQEEKGTVLVMDVKGLQRRNLNDVLLKRLRIKGKRTWFLTNIESVDDIFDAFNTDAEMVLVPTHTVRSEEEFKDILSVSDSVLPVLFVRKKSAVFIGDNMDYRNAADEVFRAGYVTAAVFDLDDSLSEDDWTSLERYGDIIPCSFSGKIKGERFEELGFERCFTVPE